MLERLAPGSEIDGFRVGERIHSGAMGNIFRVTRPDLSGPMIMKVPRVGPNESPEGIISFETEATIVPTLAGSHVPRCVAVGDLARAPYLITEWVEGESLDHLLNRGSFRPDDVARVGAAIADAIHSLHEQDVIHLDLKPANIILKKDGTVVLIDFGLAHHARYPDLLAEETRYASGSAPYISPEQVLGTREDPRSDIFSLGVVLYEMATARLPFGIPDTLAGLRNRLWLDPVPPSVRTPGMPPWLQEIILRCLEPATEARYQSAAYVAFDLRNPEQVALTSRAAKSRQAGFFRQVKRWWTARKVQPVRFHPANVRPGRTPIIMVAVDTMHPDDERQPAIQRMTAQILKVSGEFRLVCVSVIGSIPVIDGTTEAETASGIHLEHLVRLRHWVEPLRMPAQRLSLHAIESPNPAEALLEFARLNHVDMIVLGAPGPSQPGRSWWRSVASTVTANAHCSVHVVRVPERRRARRSGEVPGRPDA
ncbi:MAG TPA: bifunctional serine/threonine-protein kinase/universal stress protein [Thermoanaerobaculia bacterium]|nr:bifunctional serine/threonine-protein kinase/universal stress protein [Thermoanaerobaculia bacterium]